MAKKRYKIVLTDDHPAMRESIADAILDRHADRLEVVAQAGDGMAAIEQVKKHRPDLIVLDIGLPRLDGIQALREIKRISKDTVVVVVSMYDDQAHVVEAIRAGADDYLFKHEALPEDIVKHVLAALDKASGSDRLHEKLFTALRDIDEDKLNLGVTKLTAAELEVLKLAAHRGHSMKEIARVLSGEERALSELTVRKHFEHIYDKLGAQSQAHAVCLAVKHGFISCDAAEPAQR
jgi:DNA-binding NarL/FixJ family response regulator